MMKSQREYIILLQNLENKKILFEKSISNHKVFRCYNIYFYFKKFTSKLFLRKKITFTELESCDILLYSLSMTRMFLILMELKNRPVL